MKKIILKINKEDELLYPCDGYILGVTNFCICFGKTYLPADIKEIKQNNPGKKVFASLNRPIFNDEVKEYKETLKTLDETGLDGIITGDVASLTYNLKTPVILDQLHLNNSSLTVKHYLNNGASGIFLTNDITLEETNEIIKTNKNSLTFKQVFGLPHLSTSVRSLVTNYLKHFNKMKSGEVYKIIEDKKEDEYFICEDYFGTHILSANPINLLNKLSLMEECLLVFDGYLLKDYKWVLEAFYENNTKLTEKIDKEFNANEGFIDKKTIYRVKNND